MDLVPRLAVTLTSSFLNPCLQGGQGLSTTKDYSSPKARDKLVLWERQ